MIWRICPSKTSAKGPSSGRWGSRLPHRRYRTVREGFPLTRLLSLWAYPIDRPHVSVSLALPRAFASWGIPPICGLRLAACSSHLESHREVTPFRVSICRGFRSVLYAGSHLRVETMYPMTTWPVGDQSRLGLPLSR
jgi:hypothetical protein